MITILVTTIVMVLVTVVALVVNARGCTVPQTAPPAGKDFKSTPLRMLKTDSDCPERVECQKRDPGARCPPIEWKGCPLLRHPY